MGWHRHGRGVSWGPLGSVFPRLWYDPYPLYARGLGLCPFLVHWSVICCQDGCLMAFAKGALPEEYLSHNFDVQCLGGRYAHLMPFLP